MTCVARWQIACSNNIFKNVYLQHSRNFRFCKKSELNKFMHSDDFMVELNMKLIQLMASNNVLHFRALSGIVGQQI